MSSLLVVVAAVVLMLQYWTLFLPQLNTEKVDLIVHGKMSYLGCFLPEYAVKIRLQLQILCNVFC